MELCGLPDDRHIDFELFDFRSWRNGDGVTTGHTKFPDFVLALVFIGRIVSFARDMFHQILSSVDPESSS